MLRKPARALLIAALTASTPGHAFMIVPSETAPGGYVVGVEADLGDRVPIAALPTAFQNPADPVWQKGLSFQWRYFRSSESGTALVALDEAGKPTLAVEFAGDNLADGDTLGMAIGLTGTNGAALHMVYVAAVVDGVTFHPGSPRHRVRATIDFEPARWGEVDGFVVFTMKYYALQKLDPAGVAAAMRRAVRREAGASSEQWLPAR